MRKHLTLLLLLVAVPALAASPRDSMIVTAAWLRAHLNDANLVLLHVGDKAEYDAKHIPGAVFAGLKDISVSDHTGKGLMLEMPPAEELRKDLEALGISDASRVVVYYGKDWISPSTRILFTLARAKERAAAPPPKPESGYRHRFLVRVRDRIVVVNAPDIDWIEAADYYVSIHAGGHAYLLREPLAELEKSLDPDVFFRAHRSAIVNLARIREIHPMFHGDSMLVLGDGSQVKLSRSRRGEFERVFSAAR